MQLGNIKARMRFATCGLLQIAVPNVQAADSDWDVDTAVLFYNESGNRVSVFESAIFAGKDLDDGSRLDLRLVVDTVTGATPNGAHASSAAQAFTTPGAQSMTSASGNITYTVKPGEMPLDDSFKDTRQSLASDWSMELDRLSKLTWGAMISKEYDHRSLGLSATYAQDFNDRNTTLTTSLGINYGLVEPYGGIPSELKPMVKPGFASNRRAMDDTKTIADILFGVSQVVDRQTIVQMSYSYGSTDGYQNDPYKVVTVIDPATGLPATSSGASFFDIATTGNRSYLYENRPRSRQRNGLFFMAVHHLAKDVVYLSYRYYWDDWEVYSHTLEFRYRYQMENGYWQPHLRYYKQDRAEFYTHDLSLGSDVDPVTGVVSKQFASHDYRLADSQTMTIGLKYGMPLSNDSELAIRAELITQSIDDGTVPVGEESPDLDAYLIQLNYSFLW